jgi:hypothetical protein
MDGQIRTMSFPAISNLFTFGRKRRSELPIGDIIALEIGKGLLAGLAGTIAISLSQMIEMKLSHRKPSTTPADAAGKVLGIQPRNPQGKVRFATAVHWAYGTTWGLARVFLGGTRWTRPWAPLAHLGAIQATAMLMLPGLGVAPPVREWGGAAIGTEIVHHAVYAAAADATYRALS